MANAHVPDHAVDTGGNAPAAVAGVLVFVAVVTVLFALSPPGTMAALLLGAVLVWDAASREGMEPADDVPVVTVRRVSIVLALLGIAALFVWS